MLAVDTPDTDRKKKHFKDENSPKVWTQNDSPQTPDSLGLTLHRNSQVDPDN